MFKTTLLWTLAAIAGVVLVAGVTYAASGLSTQTIGLSSEPLSAGEELAPAKTATPKPTATPEKQRPRKAPAKPRKTPTPVPTAAPTVDDGGGQFVPVEPGDDSGGHGRNRGSGGSGSGGGGGGDD